jgi:hypothetical protein
MAALLEPNCRDSATAGWLPLYTYSVDVEYTDNGGKDEELSWVGF